MTARSITKEEKEQNIETMRNVFFYTAMTCIGLTIMLFGGSLFIYHFIMGAGEDSAMRPMWLVLFFTIAGFLGLIIYHYSKHRDKVQP